MSSDDPVRPGDVDPVEGRKNLDVFGVLGVRTPVSSTSPDSGFRRAVLLRGPGSLQQKGPPDVFWIGGFNETEQTHMSQWVIENKFLSEVTDL